MRMNLRRLAALVAGLWAGLILGIAAIGAPASFANAARDVAGRVAGQMFAQEAYVSLVAAVALLVLVRRQARDYAQAEAEAGRGSALSANVLLVLGALFCTVFGYFAMQPMMASARAGQGLLSFGVLHGVSAVFFLLKGLLVAVLAWRLSA